jgi:UDP-N-acetylmuramoyl-L-alanyl-D-glutamate--2,6-diaminopimelate ligase
MKLKELLKSIEYTKAQCDENIEIGGICTDSNKVKAGDLFVCYKGVNCDGHDYALQAISKGALVVVCQREIEGVSNYIIADNTRNVATRLARAFYGYADKDLKLIGITGTNGKTTTTYMLKSIFSAAGKSCGVIGTLGIEYANKFISPELTTPDPIFLHSIFADMKQCGVEYVFMEVSAHALYFDKINGLHFEIGVFTNCTRDHLDFFGNMQTYAKCKMSFFGNDRCKKCVVNSDDELGVKLLSKHSNCISYGLENPADVFAVNIKESINCTTFVINLLDELYDIELNLLGKHNVYNALAACACAHIEGIDIMTMANGLKMLKSVKGRLQFVANYNGGLIFVDFAHTPDGLERSLKSLKGLTSGKLYCVFGCGGNRDRTKRPIMGEIAASICDSVIVTSDNPRYEDAYDIISQIVGGIERTGKFYTTMTDRYSAIAYAISLLQEGDILLVAGKGGEEYQEIMGVKHEYDDVSAIKHIISLN